MGWWESFRCPSCGHAYGADGGPPTPDIFRQAILREQGEWVLDAPVVPTTGLLKELRSVLSLTFTETQSLRNRLPGHISQGTRYEMTQLLRKIEKRVPSCGLVVRPASDS
jgi:hypothetical protein